MERESGIPQYGHKLAYGPTVLDEDLLMGTFVDATFLEFQLVRIPTVKA